MKKAIKERIDWLLRNQPNNLVAINALLSRLEPASKKIERKNTVRIEIDELEPMDATLWPEDKRALEWCRRFKEQWETRKTEDLFPENGSLIAFAGYCLFLKDRYKES